MYIVHLLHEEGTVNEGLGPKAEFALEGIRAVLGFRAGIHQQRLRRMQQGTLYL